MIVASLIAHGVQVREVIYTEMPSVIFVELDKKRYGQLEPFVVTKLYRRYMGRSLMDASDEDMALFAATVAKTAPLGLGIDVRPHTITVKELD